jgi:hypothetical protein
MNKAVTTIVVIIGIIFSSFASNSADEIAKYEAVAELPRDPKEKVVEAPKNMTLFLLMGQSNMAGRAKPTKKDCVSAENAYRLNRDNKWTPATAPLHFDRKMAGYGPGDAFIRAYLAEHPGESIGVIPCSVGGTSIKTWVDGVRNLEAAMYRLKAAMVYGKVAGVLWHQGESDALRMKSSRYQKLFSQMVSRVRKEVGYEVPIVVGEIGTFMPKEAELINPVIAECARTTPNCTCVSSEGLNNMDKYHFDRTSAEKLGERYYQAWKKLAESKTPEESFKNKKSVK